MIDIFATFLLLSYHKLLGVNFDLLAFVSPKNSTGHNLGRFLYYDASYEYFGKDHLPYGIFAVIMLTGFNILPIIILLLYPMKWVQRCLNYFGQNHATLHIFVDSFAGCFKDGTEPGTRDCRYIAALLLLLRIILYIAYQMTLSVYTYGACAMILAVFVVFLVVAQPYKSKYRKCNMTTIVMFILLVMIMLSFTNVMVTATKVQRLRSSAIIVSSFLAVIPQLYIIGLSIHWITKQTLFKNAVSRCKKVAILRRSASETSLLPASDGRINNYV